MKTHYLVLALVLFSLLSGGCATTNSTEPAADTPAPNGALRPCTSDNLSVRGSYEVARDVWQPYNCTSGEHCCTQDYPVSYRSQNRAYEASPVDQSHNNTRPAAQ